ncbi:MAG: hypothetical protein H7Y31_12395, partial [Chitinophagaceae bacterium]|nr:hypothetical protein [Chitinophagaceae bacterium]
MSQRATNSFLPKQVIVVFIFMLWVMSARSQSPALDARPVLFSYSTVPGYTQVSAARPLQQLGVVNSRAGKIAVSDAKGVQYFSSSGTYIKFAVQGALGKHQIRFYDAAGKLRDTLSFDVDARTIVDDGDLYSELFNLLYKGMYIYGEEGTEGDFDWNGKRMKFLVTWVLDNYHTMKGMQYFTGIGRNLIDVMATMQKKDGMIWSFIAQNPASYYYETAYGKYGFFLRDGNSYFARQPIENHVEYNYVSGIYKHWKGSGDDEWMKNKLQSAIAAMEYCLNDSLRWSAKYKLLKRGLTIDSWDFQVDDEYTPQLGSGTPMLAVYGKTKFGIFYGDNTGYILSCRELAVMLDHAGRKTEANRFRLLADEIDRRLTALTWNGRFYTHFIEEDSTVQRKLGVDMSQQFSQSNAYSLNRGISADKIKSIIESYLKLKSELPKGSPGEFYSIYPPFQTGFEPHNAIWQYMNAAVGGHVAGELALGALQNGYEKYGVDILKRILDLGKRYGEGKRVWFAYTGAYPDPPVPMYKPVDLRKSVNTDLSVDFPGMPVGAQIYDSIPFTIAPGTTERKLPAIRISSLRGFNKEVTVEVNDTAKTIYVLHTGMGK